MGVYYSWHLAAVVESDGPVLLGLSRIRHHDYDQEVTYVGRELWTSYEDRPETPGLTGRFDAKDLQHHIREVERLTGRPAKLIWIQNKS